MDELKLEKKADETGITKVGEEALEILKKAWKDNLGRAEPPN